MIRWAAWLAVFGGVCVLQIDNTPADPTPAPGAPFPSTERALLVYGVAGWDQGTLRLCPMPPVGLPPGLRAFQGLTDLTGGTREAFQAIMLAQDHNLHEPVTTVAHLAGDQSLGWLGVKEAPGQVSIWPAWDTQTAYPARDGQFFHWPGWDPGNGFVLIRNLWQPDTAAEFWGSYRRGLAWPEPVLETPEPGQLVVRFYPTAMLHPLGDSDRDFDELLAERLGVAFPPHKQLATVPGGITLHSVLEDHAPIAERLENPDFMRRVRGFRAGASARRASARRAALSDDEPWIVELAVAELGSHPHARSELPDLDPVQLVDAANRCDPSALYSWNVLAGQLVTTLRPQTAGQIETLARTSRSTQPPPGCDASHPWCDPASAVCGQALLHPAAEIRRAAMAAILDCFPPLAFRELIDVPLHHCLTGAAAAAGSPVDLRPEAAHWQPAEREAFLQTLVDRLRAQLDQDDPSRAIETLQAALELCDSTALPADSPAFSRLRELAADVCLDPRHGEAFTRDGNAIPALLAASELLRRSDPEARRAGCALCLGFPLWATRSKDEQRALWALEGDPFTAELRAAIERQRTPIYGGPRPQPTYRSGGGFFF